MQWYAVSKEGNFLKDLANKIEGLGASTSNEEYGRIMSTMLEKEEQFEKIEEEIDVVRNKLEESLINMGAEFDPVDESFTINGKKYFVSILDNFLTS